jgi:hypothetical protein
LGKLKFKNHIYSEKRALDFPGYDGSIELLLKPLQFTFSESYILTLADFGVVFAEVGPLIEAMNEMKKQAASKIEEFIASTKDPKAAGVAKKVEDSVLMKMNIVVEAPIINIPLKVRFCFCSFLHLFRL